MEVKKRSANEVVNSVNNYADKALKSFAEGSVSADRKIQEATGSLAATVFDLGSQTSSLVEKRWDAKLELDSKQYGIKKEYLEKYSPSKFRPGAMSNIFSTATNIVDAVTGVVSVGKTVNEDIKKGDRLFTDTMVDICKSVGKTGFASAGGGVMFGAALCVTGGVVAPAFAAAAGAAACGYLYGIAADELSEMDFVGSVKNAAARLKFW